MITQCITCFGSSGVVHYTYKKHHGQFVVTRLIDISSTQGGGFQDKQYGRGMRVHTLGPKKQDKSQKRTCTVCGRIS